MRGKAMKRICFELESRSINLGNMSALEFFAREGDWQTIAYANKVKTIEAWEINPEFKLSLMKNLPGATVRIGDSFERARDSSVKGMFDMIVFDNPQGTFGKNEQYCEHFEAIETVSALAKKQAIVIFNVNYRPFNFNNLLLWQKRRTQFYEKKDTGYLSIDFLLSFYEDYFSRKGFQKEFCFAVNRNEEYLSYLVYSLIRI